MTWWSMSSNTTVIEVPYLSASYGCWLPRPAPPPPRLPKDAYRYRRVGRFFFRFDAGVGPAVRRTLYRLARRLPARHDIRVTVFDDWALEDPDLWPGDRLWRDAVGFFWWKSKLIWLAGDDDPDEIGSTFCHEMVHYERHAAGWHDHDERGVEVRARNLYRKLTEGGR